MQPEEIYRPPQASLEIQAPPKILPQPQALPPFFQTAPWKMVLLSVLCLGFYQLYWFHKQWMRRRTHGESVNPIARAIFAVFFVYSLFQSVNRHIERSSAGVPLQPLSAGLLALVYVVLSLLWQLPDVLGLLVVLLSIGPLVVAQKRINALHAALGYDPQEGSRLSGGDVAAIVFGVILWLLVLAGLFAPAQG